MSFRSVAAKNVFVRMAGVMTIAGAALVLVSLTNGAFIRAQTPRSATPLNLRVPDETVGVDAIARTLITVFDQADIVALGETHVWRLDTDLRIAVVRDPDFVKKVRSIVVEFGSTTEQSTLDRYIRGENVSRAQLAQVWKTTTQAANGMRSSVISASSVTTAAVACGSPLRNAAKSCATHGSIPASVSTEATTSASRPTVA